MPPPSPAGDRPTPTPVHDDDQASPQQLGFGLLAWVEGCKSIPPERALWREILALAMRNAPETAFLVYGRKTSPSTAHHVALVIHTLTDRAGVAHATDAEIATYAQRDLKAVTRAITVLNRIWVLNSTRDNRRRGRFHSMNLGGMTLPAARRRAERYHRETRTVGPQQLALVDASGGLRPPLSGGLEPPLRGDVRTGQISQSGAAAGTPRVREADRRRQQQQQQRQEDRIEGLFAAISARAREAGHDYDERDERRRLAAGEIDVDRLQALADKLREEVREKQLRRAHGPSYGRRR